MVHLPARCPAMHRGLGRRHRLLGHRALLPHLIRSHNGDGRFAPVLASEEEPSDVATPSVVGEAVYTFNDAGEVVNTTFMGPDAVPSPLDVPVEPEHGPAATSAAEAIPSTSSIGAVSSSSGSLPKAPSSQNGVSGASAGAAQASTSAQQQQHDSLPEVFLDLQFGPPPPRPLLPVIDPRDILQAVLGAPTVGPGFRALLSRLESSTSSASPGPQLYTPVLPQLPGAAPPPERSTLPLLVYLPGIDGTGLAAYRQFPSLQRSFDLRCLCMPPSDRTPFAELVDAVAAQLQALVVATAGQGAGRPVYLLGESFGGLLALALGERCRFVDRIVLVNPATSFDKSPWPSVGPVLPTLPAEIYRTLPIALAPLLTNPFAVAANSVNWSDSPPKQLSDLAYGLVDLLPELSSLQVVLPPATLSWRLSLLKEGATYVNSMLTKVPQRVLLLAAQFDFVIPSADEVKRLKSALPRCRTRTLQGRSHAMLQEAGVDVAQIMKDEGFYVTERRTSTPLVREASAGGRRRRQQGATAGKAALEATSVANFGRPYPVELPTTFELQKAMDEGSLTTLKRLVSPVFFSTNPETGAVEQGLHHVPTQGPVLFVGNHQLFAPDMPLMIAQFLEERGVLLRGLAHPFALFGSRGSASDGDGGDSGSSSSNSGGSFSFGRFLETYGAVPVSGRNLYALLERDELALLYPGGVREAFKNKGEKYKTIWPERAEFVRHCARFGATIVPFAAIGAEDGVNQVLDGKELLATPFVGDWLREQQAKIPQVRAGMSPDDENADMFVQPLITFNAPARFYYVFGKPLATSPDMANDKEACQQLYTKVRGEVDGGLAYLLERRESDPYKDLARRLAFELSWGGKKQAPTFLP